MTAFVETRGDGYALNRTAFYQALKTEFEAYVQELNDPSKPELRKRFFKKLNDVASEC